MENNRFDTLLFNVSFPLNVYKAKTEDKTVITEVFEGSIFDGFIVRAGPNYTDVWGSTSGDALLTKQKLLRLDNII